MVGIYGIHNLLDDKWYIGQSVDIESRLNEHRTKELRGYRSSNKHLQNAIKKYGIENFEFLVLDECSRNSLDEREIYWIDFYEAYSKGYNETIGGKGVRGFIHSPESNKVISEKLKERLATPEAREELSRRAKEQMSDPSMIEVLSESSKTLWRDEDYREKQRVAQEVRWSKEEERRKASDSAKKRSQTVEGKSNLSVAARALWDDPEKKQLRIEQYRKRKWMYHPDTKEHRFVIPELFDECLSEGFLFGRLKHW